MGKSWKILILALVLVALWIRLSPAIPWTIEAREWEERLRERGWVKQYEECWVEYEWSWWSLRFTSVYLECED